jgi:N utilization substance protein B
MGKRRSSREFALKFLYQSEFNEGDVEEQLSQFQERSSCNEEVGRFLDELVHTVLNHKGEIDSILRKYSDHWALDRMTVIDRNILRIGVCELMYLENIPPKVAINEAVEISKKYGSEDSPDFINGVLDRIYKDRDVTQTLID